jgi:hypothetical protein
MGTHFVRLRAAVVLLLVGSGLLFAVGSTVERNQHHGEQHPAAAEVSGESAEKTNPTEESHGDAGAKILGVDTESVALSVIAVVASLLLAVVVWLGHWPRLTPLAVAAFGLVFAAGDTRELVHQLRESNAGLAAIAGTLIVLHLAVAVLAVALYPRRRGAGELAAAEPLG